jgi:hypothetical protein
MHAIFIKAIHVSYFSYPTFLIFDLLFQDSKTPVTSSEDIAVQIVSKEQKGGCNLIYIVVALKNYK